MLIAQLSDIHVRPRGMLFKGIVDSNRMFEEAIDHLLNLKPAPDVVMISGDLVDDGIPDEYAMVVDVLRPMKIPLLLMPGNHDNTENLRLAFANVGSHAYLPKTGPLHYCINDFDIRIVALDSRVPGKHHGRVDDFAVEWLRLTLAQDQAKPTIVFLHHPPFESGIDYLDQYRCFNPEPLGQVIAECSNIEAVLCGHVHRSMFKRWAGTVVAACPSTTTQIALQLQKGGVPQSYQGPAACLLHWWTPSAGLVSHTSYIGQQTGPYAFI